jgi:transketolase
VTAIIGERYEFNIESQLEDECINTIRILSADAVQNANAGHPGMPMGAAAMAFTLWTRFLKHNPRNPQWFDRDRFVLSAETGQCCCTLAVLDWLRSTS